MMPASWAASQAHPILKTSFRVNMKPKDFLLHVNNLFFEDKGRTPDLPAG